jgi:hypothetical protein
MTIIFAGIKPCLIVMIVDSAVTNTFIDHREYDTGRKSYDFPGVGVVATWGDRSGNNIGQYLRHANITAQSHTIADLRNIVWAFLKHEFMPHKSNMGDVGYYIAGFDKKGQPCFYQILWAARHRNIDEIREYQNYDSSPETKSLRLAYDGRFDLAHKMVMSLFDEINAGKDIRYDISTSVGLIQFGDFVVRFASELTPQVGPPFSTFIINPQNQIEIIRSESLTPLAITDIQMRLKLLKIEGK